MKLNPIVREISNLIIPAILLFAVYVQLHGDFGPGGGFQAGVIWAAGMILYTLVYGLEQARRIVPPRLIEILVALGILIYVGVGVVTLIRGGHFLDYNVLAHDPHHGQHWGIFFIELGVGITVAAVMATIFFSFTGRKE